MEIFLSRCQNNQKEEDLKRSVQLAGMREIEEQIWNDSRMRYTESKTYYFEGVGTGCKSPHFVNNRRLSAIKPNVVSIKRENECTMYVSKLESITTV